MKRAVALLAASTVLAAGAACSQCGAPSGQPDAGDAAEAQADVNRADSMGDATASDGAVINDWAGWRRESELDPTCATDVPIDPATAMPKLAWIPCSSGRIGCQELDLSQIPHPTAGGTFTQARTASASGYLVFQHLTDEKDVAEWDVYDRQTLAPRIAWRFAQGVTPDCLASPIPTADQLVVYATFYGTSNLIPATAVGTPAALLMGATFVHWSDDPQARAQFIAASDTTFAGDLGAAGAVMRLPPATTTYVKTNPQGLSQPLVDNDDVLAWNEHGNSLWGEEVVVNSDASTYVLRAVTGKNVMGVVTDGASLWWVETSGTTDPDQTTGLTIDVFQAPYTTNATTLATTAKKLTTFASATAPAYPIVFNGIYAWAGGLTTYLVRANGTSTTLASDGKTFSKIPVYVSDAEYWSIESTLPSGPDGVAFTKIQLGSW